MKKQTENWYHYFIKELWDEFPPNEIPSNLEKYSAIKKGNNSSGRISSTTDGAEYKYLIWVIVITLIIGGILFIYEIWPDSIQLLPGIWLYK